MTAASRGRSASYREVDAILFRVADANESGFLVDNMARERGDLGIFEEELSRFAGHGHSLLWPATAVTDLEPTARCSESSGSDPLVVEAASYELPSTFLAVLRRVRGREFRGRFGELYSILLKDDRPFSVDEMWSLMRAFEGDSVDVSTTSSLTFEVPEHGLGVGSGLFVSRRELSLVEASLGMIDAYIRTGGDLWASWIRFDGIRPTTLLWISREFDRAVGRLTGLRRKPTICYDTHVGSSNLRALRTSPVYDSSTLVLVGRATRGHALRVAIGRLGTTSGELQESVDGHATGDRLALPIDADEHVRLQSWIDLLVEMGTDARMAASEPADEAASNAWREDSPASESWAVAPAARPPTTSADRGSRTSSRRSAVDRPEVGDTSPVDSHWATEQAKARARARGSERVENWVSQGDDIIGYLTRAFRVTGYLLLWTLTLLVLTRVVERIS